MNKKEFLMATIMAFSILMLTDVAKSEVEGVTADLTGNVLPISEVKVISSTEVSSTVEKTIEVLEKIEQVEKEKGKAYYDKITTIEPKNAADQYCYVKIIIKQQGNNIIKEETLECADGRKKVDGPSYWELFAQFYYRDVATPEYCRWYSRKNHVFKSFGKTCLNKDGEWKVKQ